ncbi:MAG: ATP-dependent DNA helicase [Candidatus Woesearchaeota archaeon]|jgi:DNA excision repair protein ERCC-2
MGHKDYFPFEIRKEQDKLLDDCILAVTTKKKLIANAPTGLGKTVAAISSALYEAIEKDQTIFFVTSRHTQHKIVIDTLKIIKDKFNLNFAVADFIGKMWMCAAPGVTTLTTSEFSDYCKSMVEAGKCSYYKKTRSKNMLSFETKVLIGEIEKMGILDVDTFRDVVCKEELCPFEIACEMAKKARVVIADYYHVFHPSVRASFFKRIGKNISDSIIIVDEAHNLPYRVRDLSSSTISTFVINRAIGEAKHLDREELIDSLSKLHDIFSSESSKITGYNKEAYVLKSEILSKINILCDDDLDAFIEHLYNVGEELLEEKKISYLHFVADFLVAFQGTDNGFARILTKSKDARGKDNLVLSYKCLDPSIICKDIFNSCQSAILMSGTLHPPEMYRDLLGIPSTEAICKTYESPFDEKNRLSLIIPFTSTKYEKRGPLEYEAIAKMCTDIVHAVPGNVAIFVPSYGLLENISKYFSVLCRKTLFLEQQGMSKRDREDMLTHFKTYALGDGAVLFGVSGGSFSEGIDLPGNELICVIVVGLPLTVPDLEMKSTIEYYDNIFGRGYDYGYLFPAFNRVLQSAGRCIRTDSDRGVLIFLDERYAWKQYLRCFPPYLKVQIGKEKEDCVRRISEFFKE